MSTAIAVQDDRFHIVEHPPRRSSVLNSGRSAAVSHSAQYFATKKTNLSVSGTNTDGVRSCSAAEGSEMHRDDLMNPDLLSEIVLLGSATLIFITLVAFVVTAFSRVAAL